MIARDITLATATRSSLKGKLVLFLEEHSGEHTVATLSPRLGISEDRRDILRSTLVDLARSGQIQRVRPGAYASLATDLATLAPVRPSSFMGRLVSFLGEHPGEHTAATLFAHLGLPEDRRSLLRSTLVDLARSGRIQRVRQGVYASLATDVTSIARVAPSTLTGRLLSFLEDHPGEHTVATLLPSIGLPENRQSSVLSILSILAKSGQIQRVRQGVYASLDTDLAPLSRVAPTTLRSRLVSFFEEHPGKHTTAMLLPSLGLPKSRRKSVYDALAFLATSGQIQCVKPGVFAAIPTSRSSRR